MFILYKFHILFITELINHDIEKCIAHNDVLIERSIPDNP